MGEVGSRQVGQFPDRQRRVNRIVPNPMDRSTIVSIYPKEINDVKETTQPSKYCVPAGSFEDPTVVVVGPSVWQQDYDADKPIQEIPCSSIQVAESVIRDYCIGLLGVEIGVAQPGMFFIPGSLTKVEIKTKYTAKLLEAQSRQDNWYRILVRLADSLWARGNGNPLIIWDEMRMAARSLGYDSKPWLKDMQMSEMTRCFACGSLKNPEYPVCLNCRIVDPNHPKAKDLKVLQV